MPRKPRAFPNKSLVHSPETIEEAWELLAINILLLAIEDVRQERDPVKRARAKEWLLSPAGKFIFDAVTNVEIDLRAWVSNNCPLLSGERKHTPGR